MDYFLPVVLGGSHCKRALPLIKHSLNEIYTTRRRSNKPASDIESCLGVLPKLMNSLAVELMTASESGNQIKRHLSDRALEGYAYIHQMLLYLSATTSGLKAAADQKIHDFMRDERSRLKTATPDLGAWLCLLPLSSMTWSQVSTVWLKEAFDRQVRWMIRDNPELLKSSKLPSHLWPRSCGRQEPLPVQDRLSLTFINSKTSLRLVMFQVMFMNIVAKPQGLTNDQILTRYNKNLGAIKDSVRAKFQNTCQDILKVGTWVEFCSIADVEVYKCSEERLFEALEQAVANSARKGYHRSNSNQNRGFRSHYNTDHYGGGYGRQLYHRQQYHRQQY